LNVIGVTGTNGKSTTAILLRSILTAAEEKSGMLGTIRYEIGSRSLSAPMTTPPADELQKYLWEMANSGCRSAVMEVSSHALSQERVRGVNFAVGIFTNLTRDHLDYHASFEEYREAKGGLFVNLSPHSIAVLNADDPASAVYAKATRGMVARYGLDHEAEVRAEIDKLDLDGCRFQLQLGEERIPVVSRLIGRHNVYNMLAAATTCWKMGYDLDAIRIGLEAVHTVPGRLEIVDAGQDFNVFVDYAHTDDVLENVLSTLRPLCAGRLLVVFGCGGDRDRGKRSKMGAVADQLADQIVLTSDNPRTEEPLEIIREITSGVTSMNYLIEPDRRAAIRLAVSMARKKDVVLIAGKGHESVQVIGTEARPFDDGRVTREVLSGLGRKFRKSS
jgi:UDP-N-acetylmuramoyl-L-alanyl-D-glutamate--2,6-diaminopimelate ligase